MFINSKQARSMNAKARRAQYVRDAGQVTLKVGKIAAKALTVGIIDAGFNLVAAGIVIVAFEKLRALDQQKKEIIAKIK